MAPASTPAHRSHSVSTPFPADLFEAAAVVVLRIAGLEGPAFPLDPARRNIIGRGEDSLVAIADRLASRSHLAIRYEPGDPGWILEDLGSRNGTWLDGLPVTSASLREGSLIRVGTTELVFRLTRATAAAGEPEVVRSGSPGELEGAAMQRAVAAGEGRWSMFLYQTGIRLLTARDPSEIVAVTLELAAEFTTATSFGWFNVGADGGLEAVCVVPPGSGLAALVTGQGAREVAAGRAVWLTKPDGAGVACVPLMAGPRPPAVLAAAAAGGLRESDFDLLLALATFAAAARSGREPQPTQAAAPIDPPGPAAEGPMDEALAPDDGTISLSRESLLAWQAADHVVPVSLPRDAASLRIDEWEQALTLEALRRSGGNVPAAATLLGLSRATLYRRLEAWGLTRQGNPPARA